MIDFRELWRILRGLIGFALNESDIGMICHSNWWLPFDGECQGHVDASGERNGGEGVEEVGVEDWEDLTLHLEDGQCVDWDTYLSKTYAIGMHLSVELKIIQVKGSITT